MKPITTLKRLLHHRREQLQQELLQYQQDREAAALPRQIEGVLTAGDLTAASDYHQHLAQLATVADQRIIETQAALQATARETQELTRLSERQEQRQAVAQSRRDERRLWDEVIRPHMIKEHSS